jgi:hypothetical protein
MASIFGWEIRRQKKDPVSFAPPIHDDGAALVSAPAVGGSYGTYVDLDGDVRNEAELITKYREMDSNAEVRKAVNHIVNEAIVREKERPIVTLDLDELEEELPPAIRDVLYEEFEEVLRLLEFNTSAFDIFRRWYVDGRLYYHAIIDKKSAQNGIIELRYVDPRKIKKIREVKKIPDPQNKQVMVQQTTQEYYVYNEKGFNAQPNVSAGIPTADIGIKIARDAVVYVTSGILDTKGTSVLSYLHDAIRPLNMFRTIQDAAIIYRMVRAPQRRVFYIDVGNLPKQKAEQYIKEMMTQYKNKLVFDPTTGAIRDDRKQITMLEDFWLSRREGGRGTEIQNLEGQANWGVMEEVEFFLKQLYQSLQVPLTRLDPAMTVPLGHASEITREEVDFARFVDRIRSRFAELFLEVLERQVILKGIMAPEEWDAIRNQVEFTWCRDNYFSELKEMAVLNERFTSLQLIAPFIGQFVSNKWVRETLLRQSEEDMEKIDEEILEERENPLYMVQTAFDGSPAQVPGGMNMPPLPPPDVHRELMAPKPKTRK